jgi:hypothetical protein
MRSVARLVEPFRGFERLRRVWRSAAIGVVLAALLAGCSWGGGTANTLAPKSGAGSNRAPLVASGGLSGGPGSGLWGDTSSGPTGFHLGCIPGRRFTLVFGLRNRSSSTLTVTHLGGPQLAPRIIRRIRIQVELAPRPQQGDAAVAFPQNWSSLPFSIPAGKSALVQSSFLMGHCENLGRHRTLIANRVIVIAYREGTSTGHQTLQPKGARIVLTLGPMQRACAAPEGASRLTAFDVSCGTAAQAAVTCHRLQHGTWGRCSAASNDWDCTYTNATKRVERCWLATKRQSVKILWS